MSNYPGSADVHADNNDYNRTAFLIQTMIGKQATMTLVRVEAVDGGGLGPIGTVDVLPLVYQVDGSGQAFPQSVIHGLPFFRLQGGARGAIICDPVVGDIGMAAFCDRDISSVKANKGPAIPASRRRNDWADGLYIGAFLAEAPEQYVMFEDGQITVKAPTVIIDAGQTNMTGNVAIAGDLTVAGGAVVTEDLTAEGISVHDHVHKAVTPGLGLSGPPNE